MNHVPKDKAPKQYRWWNQAQPKPFTMKLTLAQLPACPLPPPPPLYLLYTEDQAKMYHPVTNTPLLSEEKGGPGLLPGQRPHPSVPRSTSPFYITIQRPDDLPRKYLTMYFLPPQAWD